MHKSMNAAFSSGSDLFEMLAFSGVIRANRKFE